MTTLRIAPRCLVLLLTLAAAAPAGAQVTEPVLINGLTPQELSRQGQARAVEISEDLQVMALILRENLLGRYGGPHAALDEELRRQIGTPLGEHLPGYGVLLQVEIPAPRVPEEKSPPGKPELSRWEMTRRALRGEPVAPPELSSSCTHCHQAGAAAAEYPRTWAQSWMLDAARPEHDYDRLAQWMLDSHVANSFGPDPHSRPVQQALVDTLIDTLAENGPHFRNLAADERVALAVSFQYAPREFGKSADAGEYMRDVHTLAFTLDGSLIADSQELTGDLLVKQGQFAKAIEAYERVLDQVREANREKPAKEWPEPHRRLLEKLIDAARASGDEQLVSEALLAIARPAGRKNTDPLVASDSSSDTMVRRLFLDLLGRLPTPEESKSLGEGDERIRNLDRLIKAAWRREDGGAANRLPVRIRVSATKGVLEAFANGALTREEFLHKVETTIVDPRHTASGD